MWVKKKEEQAWFSGCGFGEGLLPLSQETVRGTHAYYRPRVVIRIRLKFRGLQPWPGPQLKGVEPLPCSSQRNCRVSPTAFQCFAREDLLTSQPTTRTTIDRALDERALQAALPFLAAMNGNMNGRHLQVVSLAGIEKIKILANFLIGLTFLVRDQ